MFTKKKKDYRTFIFTAIIITLCLLVVALLWPEEVAPADNNLPSHEVSNEPANGTVNSVEDNEAVSVPDEPFSEYDEEPENDIITDEGETYYLVKRAGEHIVVYFCNSIGEPTTLETTGIIYELLSLEDQKKFDEGITLKNQEELSELLQDFES